MKFYQALEQWRKMAGIGAKPRTREYHAEILGIIRRNWPNPEQDADTINREDVAAFAVRVAHYSAPRFNAMINCLRSITPAATVVDRRPVVIKDRANLNQLQFSALLDELDIAPKGHGGLVVRFLSQTGMRIQSARLLRWENVKADHIFVPAAIAKNGKARSIPFIAGTEQTLARLKVVTGRTEIVLPQSQCRRALVTACKRLGLPHLSHHDFRHLFATRCIESGVDIPTVARWLGHSDGGALLGRVYFHLSGAHSQAMAARVRI
jgi:integrase